MVKKELAKLLVSLSSEEQVDITKTMAKLDEDAKAIVVRQKHIKITDRSELGWGVVATYKNDELVEGSEKRLFKAKKETEETAEG